VNRVLRRIFGPDRGEVTGWRKLNNEDVRLKVFMGMKIQVMVFWVVTLCSDVVGYQLFGGLCCLHFGVETAWSSEILSQPRKT